MSDPGDGYRRSCAIRPSLAVLALLAASCSDSEGEPAAYGGESDGPSAADPIDTAAAVEAAFTVNVVARDYTFEGTPATVPVGTRISLTSVPEGEPHEMVVYKVDHPIEIGPDTRAAYWVQAYAGATDDPGLRDSVSTLTEPGHCWYLCTFPLGLSNGLLETQRVVEDVDPAQTHWAVGMLGEFDVVEESPTTSS